MEFNVMKTKLCMHVSLCVEYCAWYVCYSLFSFEPLRTLAHNKRKTHNHQDLFLQLTDKQTDR